MAMLKYGSAVVVEPNISQNQWQSNLKTWKVECGKSGCRIKTAKTIIAKYSPEKYLLSHCTIIAAVDTELADPSNPKTDYYIHPAYSKLINNNGDAWSKKMLAACYRTFIGANNYLEHVQIPELKKGKVIDAVLREVPIGKDKKGKELTTYYVDILVATERKHKELIRKIESKELTTLSMGCKIAYSICSKCGNKAVDDSEACEHVKYEKNNIFYDENGIQRKVAELCLPWNNKILRDNGQYEYIENIRVGDRVISHKGQSKKVLEIFNRPYAGDLIRIKAEGLSRAYESTPEHPFYVYDGNDFTFKKALDLKLSDFLVSRAPVEEKSLDDLNENRAMLLGLYAAEGCCYSGNIVEFVLNPTDEQDLAQEIMHLLEVEFSPEVNRYREKKDWRKIIEVEDINPVKRSKEGETLLDEDYVCLSCGAPSEYVIFHKTGRTHCKVCGAQLNRDANHRFSRANLYSYKRKYIQNFIGDREISKDGSNKFFIRYKNKACFDFFTKYCPGKRAFLKTLSKDIIYAPRNLQKIILSNWLKGDGSVDTELRLRGYTTSENLFRSMEILALRLNYWVRSQIIYKDQLVDLGELRKIKYNTTKLVDENNCHARFVLYFSPRDSGDLCIDSGFVEEYPSKRPEIRKKEDCFLHKIRDLSCISFNGSVYNIAVEEDNSYLVDGIVTHNCGHYSEPDSVTFIDASWVVNPAFTGAVIRNIVDPPENIMAKLEEANSKEGYLFQDGDFLKAAHVKAQEDTDKEPPPPTEGPKEEEPSEKEPADEPAGEPVEEEKAPEEEPAEDLEAPTGEPEPPLEQNNVKVWKDKIKKRLLKELGDEISEEFEGEEDTGPRELSTLDESLVQPTASIVMRQLWKSNKLLNGYLKKVAGNLDKKSLDRLRFGAYMLLTSNDLTVLSNYGYNRRDFLAVMSYIDSYFKKPLALDLKKAVAILETTKGMDLRKAIYALSKLAGRKLEMGELKKAITWLKLMDSYR